MLSAEKMEFIVSEYSKDAVLFVREKSLVCDLKSGSDNVVWSLRRVHKHVAMKGSALLESQASGYVLDVVDNAEKEGASIVQSGYSGLLCQRWKF